MSYTKHTFFRERREASTQRWVEHHPSGSTTDRLIRKLESACGASIRAKRRCPAVRPVSRNAFNRANRAATR